MNNSKLCHKIKVPIKEEEKLRLRLWWMFSRLKNAFVYHATSMQTHAKIRRRRVVAQGLIKIG